MSKSAKPSAFSRFYLLAALFFDKRMPKSAKWLVVASLLYTLLPVDLIPDFLLGVGQLDDLSALIAAALYFWQQSKRLMPPR